MASPAQKGKGPAVSNVLPLSARVRVANQLVEGTSIRATVRLTGVAKATVMRFGVTLGEGCARLHNLDERPGSVEQVQMSVPELQILVEQVQMSVPELQMSVPELQMPVPELQICMDKLAMRVLLLQIQVEAQQIHVEAFRRQVLLLPFSWRELPRQLAELPRRLDRLPILPRRLHGASPGFRGWLPSGGGLPRLRASKNAQAHRFA